MSEYPRMMYHRDGRSAVADSAHHEKTDFSDWSRTPDDVHRKEPADGVWKTTLPVGERVEGDTARPPQDQPGPVDAGTVRAIIRQEMQEHPGFDLDGLATTEDFEALSRKVDLLLSNLGVEMPTDETAPGDDAPRKRRGRPPGSPNKLSGAAGETQE